MNREIGVVNHDSHKKSQFFQSCELSDPCVADIEGKLLIDFHRHPKRYLCDAHVSQDVQWYLGKKLPLSNRRRGLVPLNFVWVTLLCIQKAICFRFKWTFKISRSSVKGKKAKPISISVRPASMPRKLQMQSEERKRRSKFKMIDLVGLKLWPYTRIKIKTVWFIVEKDYKTYTVYQISLLAAS